MSLGRKAAQTVTLFFFFFKGKTNFLLFTATAATAKSLQSCPTLCDPIDGSPPGSPVPGIFQARILEWGAISWTGELGGLPSMGSHRVGHD